MKSTPTLSSNKHRPSVFRWFGPAFGITWVLGVAAGGRAPVMPLIRP